MIRCGQCERHIRPTEPTCPFCTAARPRGLRLGLLGAGLLLLSGCPTSVPEYGVPPIEPDAATDGSVDAARGDDEMARRTDALGVRGAALAQAFDGVKP